MDPVTATIIAEVLKAGIAGAFTYMRSRGATDEQILTMYNAAVEGMLSRDPDNIPDPN